MRSLITTQVGAARLTRVRGFFVRGIRVVDALFGAVAPKHPKWWWTAGMTFLLAGFAPAQAWRYSHDLSGNLATRTTNSVAAPLIVGQP